MLSNAHKFNPFGCLDLVPESVPGRDCQFVLVIKAAALAAKERRDV